MKRIILTAMIALAAFTFSASAQNGNRPEKPTPEQTTERMAKQLELTDAQKSQVQALNTEYQDVIGGPGMGKPNGKPNGKKATDGESGATTDATTDANRPQRPELTDEQKAEMEAMQAKREEYNTKLKAILSDDQYTKYEKSQKHGPKGNRDKNKASE